MSNLVRFFSNFGQWLQHIGAPSAERRRFMSALRRACEVELPNRECDYEVTARDLTNSEGLRYWFRGHDLCVFPAVGDSLAVSVVGPDWARGWRSLSRDEFVRDEISNFFHLARQYIIRSRTAAVLAGLAIVYDRTCDFRGAWLDIRRGSEQSRPAEDMVNDLIHMRAARYPICPGSRSRQMDYWIRSINALDSFIHRAVFQFLRARHLSEAGFGEESVTALDGLSSVAAQFAQQRMGVHVRSRAELAAVFSLSRSDGKLLAHLYELRCDFGAHPGWSKWWDFGEIYEDLFSNQFDTAKRLLVAIIRAESEYRLVDPFPESWSEWFSRNAMVVYDAVWFHRIR